MLDLLEERLLLDLDLELSLGLPYLLPLGDRLADVLRLLASGAHLFGELSDLLADLLGRLPDFLTCLATPLSPRPVPGIGMPRTFLGRRSLLPRTTPPTTPAAAVTTPVTTAAFDEPFGEVFRARSSYVVADARDRDDEPASEDEAEERRLDALALFGLLRELEALLPFEDVLRVLLRDALLLGLDPFELREVVFLLLCDREPVWAISPP